MFMISSLPFFSLAREHSFCSVTVQMKRLHQFEKEFPRPWTIQELNYSHMYSIFVTMKVNLLGVYNSHQLPFFPSWDRFACAEFP